MVQNITTTEQTDRLGLAAFWEGKQNKRSFFKKKKTDFVLGLRDTSI